MALLTVKEVIGEEEEEEEEEKVDVTLEEKTPLEVVAEGKLMRQGLICILSFRVICLC